MKKFINPPALSTSFSENGKNAKKRFDNILSSKAKKTGTIALILVLALVGIVGTLVACSTNKDIYTNAALGFSVEIPSSWAGKYEIEESGDYVSFIHKAIKAQYGEGTGRFFGIGRQDGELSKEKAEDTPQPTHFLMTANGYTYTMSMPSDVQHPLWDGGDKVLADEYEKMAKDIEQIRKSIKAVKIDGSVPASDITRLYELKDTYVGDNSKVRKIVDLANFTDIDIESMELQTANKPYGITVNYKVGSRANYRFLDYGNFDKTAAVIFALVPNVDEVKFFVYDDYRNVFEDSFAGSYCSRQNISEGGEMEYFNDENVRKATSSLETFTEYYNKVSGLNPYSYNGGETGGNAKRTAIYAAIGDDSEIITNSGLVETITITKEIASNKTVQSVLTGKNIKLDEYIDKKIEFITYAIRNFKTNEATSYLFVFDGNILVAYEDLKGQHMDITVMHAIRPYADKE